MDGPSVTGNWEWLWGVLAAGALSWIAWLHSSLGTQSTKVATLEERLAGVATAQSVMGATLTERLTRIEEKLDHLLEK